MQLKYTPPSHPTFISQGHLSRAHSFIPSSPPRCSTEKRTPPAIGLPHASNSEKAKVARERRKGEKEEEERRIELEEEFLRELNVGFFFTKSAPSSFQFNITLFNLL
jgi:hypothetical protein